MSDEINNNPDNTPDDGAEEHKRKMAELFGDIEDESEDTVESLRAEKAALLQQVATLTQTVSRSQADNLTLSRSATEAKASLARAEAKFEQDKKFAVEKFVKEVLPVVDTLELGLNSIPKAARESDPKFAKLAEGVEKTLGQLTAVFNKFGIREINPINQAFDENKHEAITMIDRPDVEPETVVQVAQKGYEIEGRVIRPAKVIVTPPL